MTSPDSKVRARAELINLLDSQLDTLEKETFGVVTEVELCEYDERSERIRELCAEVIDSQKAAA
jgi:hypothetical protein